MNSIRFMTSYVKSLRIAQLRLSFYFRLSVLKFTTLKKHYSSFSSSWLFLSVEHISLKEERIRMYLKVKSFAAKKARYCVSKMTRSSKFISDWLELWNLFFITWFWVTAVVSEIKGTFVIHVQNLAHYKYSIILI